MFVYQKNGGFSMFELNRAFVTLQSQFDELQEQLPDLLSELLSVALSDVEFALERGELSGLPAEVTMSAWLDIRTETSGRWFWRKQKKVCSACLAGSCIAQRLDLPAIIGKGASMHIQPQDFPPLIRAKMEALNDLRQGKLYDAWRELRRQNVAAAGLEFPMLLPARVAVPDFYPEPAKFIEAMQHIVHLLTEAGL